MNLRKINIVYGGILVSMLIGELCLSSVLNFNVIRFLQVLIFFNVILKGFKVLYNTLLFILPAFVYIFHAVFYLDEINVVGDFFNIIWWFIFMTIMNYSIKSYDDFNKFKSILFRSTFFLTTISSILGLLKLYFMSSGIILNYFEVVSADGTSEISFGSSLNADYNVYAIGLYCGLFAGLYCYKKTTNVKLKIVYTVALLLILAAGLMSGSRRGFVIGIFLIFYIIFWSFKVDSYSFKLNAFNKKKQAFIKKPWIAFVFLLVFFVSLTRLDIDSIIESSSEITSVLDRLLTLEDLSSQENDTRSNRWVYAFEFFSEMPALSKLFGDGFDYMRMFGYKFDVGYSDHPHNVWISSLLYGGIFGFISTIFLTVYVFFFFKKHKHIFKELFVWYILFLLLNFTSSNT
ncbi:O-antigen ligase family protein, partial [Flavobacterium sp. FPG59]|uniref:O-antigen ligase family protein n=1 Tax=Flavobacterium sp. FPG59 TaxID=1929267 RepID=UPI000B663418